MMLSEFKRRFEKELDKGNITEKGIEQLNRYNNREGFTNPRTIRTYLKRSREWLNKNRPKGNELRLYGDYDDELQALRMMTGGTRYENPDLYYDYSKGKIRNIRYALYDKLEPAFLESPVDVDDNYIPTAPPQKPTQKVTPKQQYNSNPKPDSQIPPKSKGVTSRSQYQSNNKPDTPTPPKSKGKRKYTKRMMEYWDNLSKGKKAAVALGTAGILGGTVYGGYKLINRKQEKK